jgi:hypothetical protein
VGSELPSERLRRFAAHVLEIIEKEPEAPVARVVEQALEGIEDGRRRWSPPTRTSDIASSPG